MANTYLVTQLQFKGYLWRRQYHESRLICWLIYLGGIGYRLFWLCAFQHNGYILWKHITCGLLLCKLLQEINPRDDATTDYREMQILTPCHRKPSFFSSMRVSSLGEILEDMHSEHGAQGNGFLSPAHVHLTTLETKLLKSPWFQALSSLGPQTRSLLLTFTHKVL